jgi:hypothetical protein
MVYLIPLLKIKAGSLDKDDAWINDDACIKDDTYLYDNDQNFADEYFDDEEIIPLEIDDKEYTDVVSGYSKIHTILMFVVSDANNLSRSTS